MPNTILIGTALCCEAAISVKILKEDGSKSPSYNYELHNKPCFGMYFKSAPNGNSRTNTLVDIKADVYQYIDQDMLVRNHENNYCSLAPDQLHKYHRELEFVFAKFSSKEDTGVKLSVEETTRLYDQNRTKKEVHCPAIKIHVEAKKMKAYQLLCLLTLIRCSSEYPNALLLKECFNLQEKGYFKEFSIMSLFALLQNRLQYAYDQGPIQYIGDSRNYFYKPSCLEFLQKRMMCDSAAYRDTDYKVQNFYEVVERGPRNKSKFVLPKYTMGGGNEVGKGKLFDTNQIITTIFDGDVPEDHIECFKEILAAIKGQFPKLKVDYPQESKS